MDASPTAIVFNSPFGGLTISLRNHLHTISHSTHLTESYMKQLVSLGGMREEDTTEEEPRPFTRSLEEYSNDDQIRLQPINDQLEA